MVNPIVASTSSSLVNGVKESVFDIFISNVDVIVILFSLFLVCMIGVMFFPKLFK